ncbi:MAG: SCO family protein, partial [Gemmatimonadota bacterium]|nr:SCO family protein [Gemmatimonadota bacterium]
MTAERAAIAALAALFAITVAWWALALWPVSSGPSEWLVRARAVCFNAGPDGLPDPSGWMLLIGQPIGMFALLMVFAGDAVRGGVGLLAGSLAGRAAFVVTGAILVVGLYGAFVRVGSAREADALIMSGDLPAPTYPRLDREAPALDLLDQHGERVTLERFRGQPVLITFAFGHCEAICPLVVHETRQAQSRLREDGVNTAML